MSYFHVLLQFDDSPRSLRCVLHDLSERDLKVRFLRPYNKGWDILVESEVIKIPTIRKIQIIKTGRMNEVEREDIKVKSRRELAESNRGSDLIEIGFGRGYRMEDIAEAGVDVTADYLSHAPGGADRSATSILFHNPWVITVGGGLLVAFIAWRLGWVGN